MNIVHKPGDKLPNGAVVLGIDYSSNGDHYVLAVYRGEFVTWLYCNNGETCYGKYFKDLREAMDNLKERVEKS